MDSKVELSRGEQKELEKQRAREHYQKLHAEGKTKQARADLARLAIIKQHRAEAAARREAEKKGINRKYLIRFCCHIRNRFILIFILFLFFSICRKRDANPKGRQMIRE